MSENPVIIFHGWSDQAASFDRLAGILRERLKRDVDEVFLVDWLSLNDEVTYADLSVALERAWKEKKLSTRPQSVDEIIHSTGALVIRDWMTRFLVPEKNPISSKYWYGPKRVKATVLVGNQGYGGVRAAANEDGGDGTVRVSTANLNVNKIKIDLASERKDNQNRFTRHPANPYHEIAFGILDGETHGSIIAKGEDDPKHADEAFRMMERALTVTEKDWDRWCKFLSAKRKALSPKEEDLSYAQKLKQRRVGYSGHRQVTLSKAEVLKEFIPHQTLLIEIVLKREMVDLVLVRIGE